MQKSPLMVPGLESAGFVSPSITRPVFTTFRPSHTLHTKTPLALLGVSVLYVPHCVQQVIPYHGDDRAGVHVLDQAGVEGAVLQVDVVLLQQLLRRLGLRQKCLH